MNLRGEILREHSRRQTERIARWIGSNRRRFRQLVELFLKGEHRITQRSAWILTVCAENHPGLIRPYLQQVIEKMVEPGVHEAVRRNVVRILQEMEIPHRLLGRVATACFDFLSSGDASIAVKANSMTVLERIALKEPGMARELRLVIGQQLPFASAGFRARAKKVLARIPQRE